MLVADEWKRESYMIFTVMEGFGYVTEAFLIYLE